MHPCFKIIFLYLAVVCPITGYAAEVSDFSKYSNHKVTYSLPVNATSTPKIHLLITSLEGFVVSPENFNTFNNGHSTILEYIPKDEALENWSKIITLSSLKGNKLQSDQYIKGFVEFVATKTKRSKVITQKIEKRNGYIFSNIAFQYMYDNGQSELIYMEYYSGPYDCSGIQYTIKLDKWLDGNDSNNVAKKLERYIKQHVSVLQF